jgi:hypothetical protein
MIWCGFRWMIFRYSNVPRTGESALQRYLCSLSKNLQCHDRRVVITENRKIVQKSPGTSQVRNPRLEGMCRVRSNSGGDQQAVG